jgi:hypothetical protein
MHRQTTTTSLHRCNPLPRFPHQTDLVSIALTWQQGARRARLIGAEQAIDGPFSASASSRLEQLALEFENVTAVTR